MRNIVDITLYWDYVRSTADIPEVRRNSDVREKHINEQKEKIKCHGK